jgi:Protein of unknown function (DUF3551)
MRGLLWSILAIATLLNAAPAGAQGRYDSKYPFCMEGYDSGGVVECGYTSLEQCQLSAAGQQMGTCLKNPYYVAPPPEETSPAPPAESSPVAPTRSPRRAGGTQKQGRYDSKYPFCKEAYDSSGSVIECSYTSMEECKMAAERYGMCSNNPYYVAPPPEETRPAESAPVAPAGSPRRAGGTQK